MTQPRVTTAIATSDETSITVRGRDLVHELIGKFSFTELLYFHITGREASAAETRLLDACLVTLMEHGWTPSALIARLAHDSNPSQTQIGMAAGLLAIGDVFAGTMEGCGRLLAEGLSAPDTDTWCSEVVQRHRSARKAMPGFGHPFHKPDDPRPPRLFQIAAELGRAEAEIALLKRLSAALDEAAGRHITINATGAMAAVLHGIGVPPALMRGVSVVSRAGGLLGHIAEEEETHAAREVWRLAEEHIPYRGDAT